MPQDPPPAPAPSVSEPAEVPSATRSTAPAPLTGDGSDGTGRRSGCGLAVAVLIIVVLAGIVALCCGRPLFQRWGWGVPVLVEDFSDPAWKNRWAEQPSHHGMFTVKDGRLVSIAERSANIHLKQRLTTPVAIEYTGEMLPGSEPCDLSMTWNEGGPAGIDDSNTKGQRNVVVQSGGYGNTAFFMLLSGNRLPVSYTTGKLENGRAYRFRIEIEDTRISLYVDGRLKIRHEDLIPFVSGYVGLYGHYPGKAFSDVRIWQKTPAPGISPMAVGDHFLLQNDYADALSLYEQVRSAHGDSDIGQQARFRCGLTLWRMGRRSEALEAWKPINLPGLRMRIDAFAMLGDQDAWMRENFAADFTRRYRQEVDRREMLRNGWFLLVERLAAERSPDPQLEDRILALRTALFPDDDRAAYAAGNLLTLHGRYEEAIRQFPGNAMLISGCRLAMGHSAEVLAQTGYDVDARVKAWQMRGEFLKVIDAPGVNPVLRALALCKLGRGDELLNDPDLRYPVLLHLGRAEDLLNVANPNSRVVNEALICLGRWAEAAGPGLPTCPGSGGSSVAQLLLGDPAAIERADSRMRAAYRYLQAAEAGDAKAQAQWGQQVALPNDLRYHEGWFTAAIARPLIERLGGDAQAIERLRPQLDLFSGIFGKRPWYLARVLLGDTPPDGVLEMPAVSEREAWGALARGMCAELAGDAATARSAYQEFSALPLTKRLLALNTPDPEVEAFVRWRLRALGG
jgi:tetratricopeptide (TPR) repeat protein